MYISFGNEFASRIYAFQTVNCKGFQIGDPALNKRIRLYLFADEDHDLEISISALDLNQLKQIGILESERKGTWIWYSISQELPSWGKAVIGALELN